MSLCRGLLAGVPREMGVGHLQTDEREMRLHPVELGAEIAKCLGKPAGRDDHRRFAPWPLLLYSTHDPVDRLGLAEHDAGADAVFGAAPDDMRWDDELRGRQLRCAPN